MSNPLPPLINDFFPVLGPNMLPRTRPERELVEKKTSLNLGGGGGGGGGRGIFRFFGNVHMVPKDPKIEIKTIVAKRN
jgi:hypothetical protein